MADAAASLGQITLTVNADNARAVRLYGRHGFNTIERDYRDTIYCRASC